MAVRTIVELDLKHIISYGGMQLSGTDFVQGFRQCNNIIKQNYYYQCYNNYKNYACSFRCNDKMRGRQ